MHVRSAREGVKCNFSSDRVLSSSSPLNGTADVGTGVAVTAITCSPELIRVSSLRDGGALRLQLTPNSRSDYLTRDEEDAFEGFHHNNNHHYTDSNSSTNNSGGSEDYNAPFYASRAVRHCAALSMEAEVIRGGIFQSVLDALNALTTTAGRQGADSGRKHHQAPLLTVTQREELPARWVMEAVSVMQGTAVPAVRRLVTPADVGAAVVLLPPSATTCMQSDAELRSASTEVMRLLRTAAMCRGEYWVEVGEITASREGAPPVEKRLDCGEVSLAEGVPIYADAFLPSDEAFDQRGTSMCIFTTLFLVDKNQQRGAPRRSTPPQQHNATPEYVAVQMASVAYEARRKLAQRTRQLLLLHASSTDDYAEDGMGVRVMRVGMDVVRLTGIHNIGEADGAPKGKVEVEVLSRTVIKLARMWDARVAATTSTSLDGGIATVVENMLTPSSGGSGGGDELLVVLPDNTNNKNKAVEVRAFYTRLTTLLLRYRLLFGHKGYNQGPHAAVPPAIMAQLLHTFDVRMEAFASPLNAQLAQYGSLFPDTDSWFGSVGSFFDVEITAGHVEVNPPFDARIIDLMQRKLLASLAASDDMADGKSLLYVVVLPSHDLDDDEKKISDNNNEEEDGHSPANKKPRTYYHDSAKKKPSAERILRESAFCLSHCLCAARESAYVDGHQHLLRHPLFCIGTPTRLIVLGNAAARRLYPDAAARLEAVKKAWALLTEESRVPSSPSS